MSPVKRLLLAAAIAVAAHGLLLAVKPPWNGASAGRPAPEPISLELQMLPRPTPAPHTSAPADDHPEPSAGEPVSEAPEEPAIEPQPESSPDSEPVPEPEPEPAPEPAPDPEPVPEAEPSHLPDPVPEKSVKPAPAIQEKADAPPAEPEKPEIPVPDASRAVESRIPAEAGPRESASIESYSPAPEPLAPAVKEAKPRYRENAPPKYPRIARRRGYTGTVVLEVLVSRDGRAEEVTVSSSSGHRILDESALAAVAAWRFEPGTINGSAVSMRVKVPVRFTFK